MTTVVHVAPHPDDEALGAPGALLLLRRAGFDVVNAIVGLGRAGDHERRRREAIDAASRADFEVVFADPPIPISSGDDLETAEARITSWLDDLVARRAPALVVSPSSTDRHPGHEVVARATGRALAARDDAPTWWMWGLWTDLARPTLYVPFDDDVLAAAHHVLAAYAGELARNDYARLLTARAIAHAVLGSERVFGFGATRASAAPYADLLTELHHVDGRWRPGSPRRLDPRDPLPDTSARPPGHGE